MRNITLFYIFSFLKRFRPFEPFAIIYYSDVANSYTLGMSIFAIHAFLTAIFEIPTGILSDKIGRKKTLLLSTTSYCVAFSCFVLAQNYTFLVCGAFFLGLGFSLISGTDSAFVFETLEEKNKEDQYHHYKGTYDAIGKGSLGLSALLSSLLLIFYPIRFLYYVAITTTLLSIPILLLMSNTKPLATTTKITSYLHYLSAFRKIKRNKKLRLLTFGQIISVGISHASWRFRGVFIKSVWPVWAIGVLETVTQLMAVIGFKFGGRLIDKYGHKKLIYGYEYSNGFSFAIAGLLANTISPFFISIPNIFYSLKTLSIDHLFQQSFDNKKRATMGSIVSLGGNFLYAICAILFGGIADLFGVHIAIIAASLFQALSIPFYKRAFATKN